MGRDFNEDLLMPMAEAGQGNAWHVQEAADMAKIFAAELGGLVRQVGHSVRLTARTSAAVRVVDVLNDLERDGEAWILPNLVAGSTLDPVVRLEIGESVVQAAELAAFTLSFVGQQDQQRHVVEASFSAAFAPRAQVEAAPSDPQVAEAVHLLMNARARREAIEHADRGDHAGSASILFSRVAATRHAASYAPSAALSAELGELMELSDRAAANDDPIMFRKMAAYQRETRRKGK